VTATPPRTHRVTIACNPLKTVLVWMIRGYQKLISPALPRSCKYYPSCSQYAVDALTQYGTARGLVLAAWRLLRCNPLSYGGYDPVEVQTLFRSRGERTGRR
jgi:putative membrane protein insertion efficiency factor